MCELFGISSTENYQVNTYLKEFFAHSKDHPHGWGMAWMEHNQIEIVKEPVQASKSSYLKEKLSVPLEMKNGFAHIRKATIGHVNYPNCHPYTKQDNSGRVWTLIHNGTIFDYQPLNRYVKIQDGCTDSERVLLYFVDLINAKEQKLQRKMNQEERFYLLDSAIGKMAKGNKLNLMLYDGELFYVHTNYENSLYELKKEKQTLFATTPLSDEEWKPVTFTTLLAYREGKRVLTGTNHGNEYMENEDNLKYLYSIFAAL